MQLRIGTFNLQWGFPQQWQNTLLSPDLAALRHFGDTKKFALAAAAKELAALDLDLLALQEVDAGRLRSAKIEQTSYLAEKLGMEGYFVPVARNCFSLRVRNSSAENSCQEWGEERSGKYGIALLSRYPVQRIYSRFLPEDMHFWRRYRKDNGKRGYRFHITEPRRCAYAQVTLPADKQLLFASTHLSTAAAAAPQQLAAAAAGFSCACEGSYSCERSSVSVDKTTHIPAILAGDFNMRAEAVAKAIQSNPVLANFALEDRAFPTYPAQEPLYSIDHILGCGVEITYLDTYQLSISDHRLLLAEAIL